MAVVKIVSLIGFIFLMAKIEGRYTSLILHSVKCIYIYIYIYNFVLIISVIQVRKLFSLIYINIVKSELNFHTCLPIGPTHLYFNTCFL
jgi:hypothetical protein